MRRVRRGVLVLQVGLVIASAAPLPASATRACPYWVSVSRENFPGEQTARICDLNRIADWLGAVPDATLSAEPPQDDLKDGFTVTLVTVAGRQDLETEPPAPGIGKVLLTERVYPVAASGPVAFVASRSVLLHHPGPFPKWVVRPGWRALDATEPVPPILRRLGMLRPTFTPVPPVSATPSASPGSGSRGPDLVSLLFIVAIVAGIGVFARRSQVRTHPRVEEDPSETLAMDDELHES